MCVGVFSAEGHTADGFTNPWDVEGCSAHRDCPDKSRDVKRALWRNCWNITRMVGKEIGPDRKRELGK